jgi:hypothetical protein
MQSGEETCDRGFCDEVRHNRLLQNCQGACLVMAHGCHKSWGTPCGPLNCFIPAHWPCIWL